MTTPTITQLPDGIANQIAAGEVIERPAAVVKELVENSIDAGATAITIRIAGGGQQVIEIIDNGHGMQPEDLPLALGRHATSKLSSADDLFQIGTLGFRGEALPSIAGVSEFSMASRPAGSEAGSRLDINGGEALRQSAEAMPFGTRITVRNLFWNVPVRLKFLKTTGTETGHITDMVTRLALGHPHIAFSLHSDSKTILDLPPVEQLESRIRSCFGKQAATGLLAVDGIVDATQLTGLIAHPEQARPTGKRQFVFLNGRHIRDKLIVAAIREGYRGFLEPRLHPVVYLHIDLDPGLVDVNVHPTKSEVRFRRDKEIFHLIRSALRKALEEHIGNFSLLGKETASPVHSQPVEQTVVKPAIQERYLPPTVDVVPSRPMPEQETSTPTSQVKEPAATYNSTNVIQTKPDPSPNPPTDSADRLLPQIHKIVQLHDMYILVETDEGIRIIDQHALHEKALWLCLDPEATDFAGSGRQELLVPKTIELAAADVQAIEPQLQELHKHGIEAEVFGPTTIAVRAHPSMLAKVNWHNFFNDLAAQGPGQGAVENLREAIGHRRACRAAVKAGDTLSPAEMQELVRLLYHMDGLEHCPHGRPTTLDLGWEELEKRFQR